jgi:rhamnopyranosyl-N-acetylglucosaminyl-diphospho-decaprenol beta-1,3/1,4-galactofuranosyltransferase
VRVAAVVVTYNRKELLARCLAALERQTHAPAAVLVVDNASTDGTPELVAAGGFADRLPLEYLRLGRNGGGAEGFHFGVRRALELDADWLWLMDDDCLAEPDALERLLASPRAADPSTAVLAPVVREPGGRVLPVNRGHVRPGRWLFAPLVAASEAEYAAGAETEIGFCSFVGPLVRSTTAREIAPPLREMFIRFEDVEYLQRLPGRMWLIGSSSMLHADPAPVAGADLRTMWADFSQPLPFAQQWKRLYGFRNLVYAGRSGGYLSAPQAVAQFAVQAVRTLLFHERRARTLLLLAAYGLDGWRGRFRNVPPERWAGIAAARRPLRYIEREALSYDPSSPATPPA